jgi:hypothetical protein
LNLVPGVYRISVHLNDSAAKRVDELEEAATIEVVEADVCGTGELPCGRRDLMYMPAEWSTCYT